MNDRNKCLVFAVKALKNVKNSLFVYICIPAILHVIWEIIASFESPDDYGCAWVLFLITQIFLYRKFVCILTYHTLPNLT